MKKTNVLLNLLFVIAISNPASLIAQCASFANLGSSSNMLTKLKYNGNTVVADKDLNTVIFIHRNNPATFGGSSGNLRYDISTDGGTTWTNDVGPVNPLLTKQARYPNVAIYNPPGNTNPGNAYLNYLAPTINGSGAWSGIVSGVRKLNGTGNTEAYGQPGPTNFNVSSLVKGAPGVYWATDFAYNGTQFTGGIMIYKGVWNGSTINWSLNQTFNPSYNLSYSGNPPLGECNIAFDPSGVTGWMCVTTHLNSSSGAYRYQPVFYKTTNGGSSWSGPMVVDLAQFSCITGGVNTNTNPGVYYANDLTVDVYGQPHMILTVGVANTTYGINSNQWHHIFDITRQHEVWTAYDIANVQVEVATIFPGSLGSNVYQIMHPQISRSADGTKVFFTWTDNTSFPLGTANMVPELYARGFDAVQNKWTPVVDVTSCNPTNSGSIFFPHMAAEALEPTSGSYKLAVVYGVCSCDPDAQATFRFINNIIFSNTDFTINQPALSPPGISPAVPAPICAGNSATLQVSGSYDDISWSNGYSGSLIYAATPGVYYVGVRQGCVVGWDSVIVSTLSMSLPGTTVNACLNLPQTLSINGNALGYTWTPGPLNGSSITVVPAANMIYTVTGAGINTCVVTATVNVLANPLPTVSATSNHSVICSGEEVILQATGGTTYSWSSGGATSTVAAHPSATTNYSVTGFTSVGCPDTFTLTQLVDACTGITKENAAHDQLMVYPNPSQGRLTIKATTDMRCTLSNELGQVLQIIELSSKNDRTVILNNLAAGIYFLSTGTQLHQKIIVQK